MTVRELREGLAKWPGEVELTVDMGVLLALAITENGAVNAAPLEWECINGSAAAAMRREAQSRPHSLRECKPHPV